MLLSLAEFAYEGKVYERGTQILLTNRKYDFLCGVIERDVPVIFIHRNGEALYVQGKKNDKLYHFYIQPNNQYIKEIISTEVDIAPHYDQSNQKKIKQNMENNFDQWVLYITLMGLATVFKGNWFFWILLTIFVKPHND